MISIQPNNRQLVTSLERAGKKFGDTSKGAIARLGVQVCRDMAFETQAFGAGAKPRKAQKEAIEHDYSRLVIAFKSARMGKKALKTLIGRDRKGREYRWPKSRFLDTPEKIIAHVERHHDPKTGRPRKRKVPWSELMAARSATFNKAVRIKVTESAGKAKGAWIGAGNRIAKSQKGADRLTIGKNFLSYAQKHASKGRATEGGDNFMPHAILRNSVPYSSAKDVMSRDRMQRVISKSARKTLKWYEMTMRRNLKKR